MTEQIDWINETNQHLVGSMDPAKSEAVGDVAQIIEGTSDSMSIEAMRAIAADSLAQRGFPVAKSVELSQIALAAHLAVQARRA